ncbi:signal peptidase I [Herbiconiux ginsengi]|uniref:Signal peptidase I n=1 Tax=Herbiconiux ginsengi TaxID=381665 RepID=A0A1H3TZU8_9MICO|nr:signal peptidase I [Herbiconiux ginsengi]SDZ55740.1 signal peptidase I [Herbiconiux ginsengi]
MISRGSVVATAGALVVALVVLMVAQHEIVFRAESASMSPTVRSGDLVIAQYYRGGVPERGSVVIFVDPGGWADRIATLSSSEHVASTFVKRVVGLPGERVTCCDADGLIRVDGRPMAEVYRADPSALASILSFDVIVPDDSVFVLGDGRSTSVDSRYLGPVHVDDIVATQQVVIPLP